MIDRLQFNRREFAGAFGDIGTSLPIIVGILLTTGLNCSGVLIAFGCAQIFTGLLYGLPMPVQPLKAMAVVVIAGQASGALLQMAGLMIGGLMLVLSASGGLDCSLIIWSLEVPDKHCIIRNSHDQVSFVSSVLRSRCELIKC